MCCIWFLHPLRVVCVVLEDCNGKFVCAGVFVWLCLCEMS